MGASTKKWEWFGAAIFSLICASLWFRPIFWEMAGGEDNLIDAIEVVFFSNAPNKMHIGAGIDFLGSLWIIAQVDAILFSGQETFLENIFYGPPTGGGYDFGLHTGYAWGDAAMATPLMKWLGFPGFYNLHVLLSLFLSQLSIILMLRTAKAPTLVSWGLSAAIMLNPFMFEELYSGRPTQTHLMFHAFVITAVLKIRRNHRVTMWAVIGGLSLSAACLVYWFSGVAVGFIAGATALFDLLHGKWKRRRSLAYGLYALIALSTTIALSSRVSIPWLLGEGQSMFPKDFPPPRMTIWTPFFDIPIQHIIRISNWSDLTILVNNSKLPFAFIGLGVLSMVALALKPKKWPWVGGGIAAIGLPIGPAIAWKSGWIVSSYAVLHGLFPPLIRCEDPERLVVVPMLVLPLAFSMTVFPLRTGPILARSLFKWSIGIGLIAYGLNQAPHHSDARYHAFQANSFIVNQARINPGAIIDLPLKSSEKTYVQQLYHKQPILGGPGQNRVQTKEHREFVIKNEFLTALESLHKTGIASNYTNSHRQELYDKGFRLILVDTKGSKANLEDYNRFLGVSGILSKREQYIALPLTEAEN